MKYLPLFEQIRDHLEKQHCSVDFDRGGALTPQSIEEFRTAVPFPAPSDLLEMYAELGDGFRFEWFTSDQTFSGMLEMSSLESLADDYRSFIDQPCFSSDFDFSAVSDPEAARATIAQMRNWLLFCDHGTGDAFGLDCNTVDHQVLYYQEEWMELADGTHGLFVAGNLHDFVQAWGQWCFQDPASLCWSELFGGGRMDWQSSQFKKNFFTSLAVLPAHNNT